MRKGARHAVQVEGLRKGARHAVQVEGLRKGARRAVQVEGLRKGARHAVQRDRRQKTGGGGIAARRWRGGGRQAKDRLPRDARRHCRQRCRAQHARHTPAAPAAPAVLQRTCSVTESLYGPRSGAGGSSLGVGPPFFCQRWSITTTCRSRLCPRTSRGRRESGVVYTPSQPHLRPARQRRAGAGTGGAALGGSTGGGIPFNSTSHTHTDTHRHRRHTYPPTHTDTHQHRHTHPPTHPPTHTGTHQHPHTQARPPEAVRRTRP